MHPRELPASPVSASPRRALVILRAGDRSLHPHWLVGAAEREWDLHISYFGDQGAPACAGLPGVTWSQDGGETKWGGVHACLEKNPVNLAQYDYVATPDDDLLLNAGTFNRAFALARQYDLAFCQLSLDPRSFYSHGLTVQRKGLLLRYVDAIETMPPIFRADVFARFVTLLSDPKNSWGLEYVVAAPLRDNPKSMAILDDVPVLHTRAHGTSKMYEHFRAAGGGRSLAETEAEYLAGHGVVKYERSALGAIRADGAEVTDMSWVRKPVFLARVWKAIYKLSGIRNIAPRTAPPTLTAPLSVSKAAARARVPELVK